MTWEPPVRRLGRWALAVVFVGAGVLHVVATDAFLVAMPPFVPAPRAMIWLSGAAEIAGGIGLLWPRESIRRAAGWGLALLLVVVYPANVHMALAGVGGPAWALWARLPLQGVLIAWVLLASGAVRGTRVDHLAVAEPPRVSS